MTLVEFNNLLNLVFESKSTHAMPRYSNFSVTTPKKISNLLNEKAHTVRAGNLGHLDNSTSLIFQSFSQQLM
jgi:hypothetical protein